MVIFQHINLLSNAKAIKKFPGYSDAIRNGEKAIAFILDRNSEYIGTIGRLLHNKEGKGGRIHHLRFKKCHR